jgi:hypothetical protein
MDDKKVLASSKEAHDNGGLTNRFIPTVKFDLFNRHQDT